MNLVNLYEDGGRLSRGAPESLYQLLKERDGTVNISHGEMPSWEDHISFLKSYPYSHWYLVKESGTTIGAIYLTRHDEIGVSIFKNEQGKGHETKAILLLIGRHRRKSYLANINPENSASIGTFSELGFKHVQNTYRLKAP